MTVKPYDLKGTPVSLASEAQVLYQSRSLDIDWTYVVELKRISGLNDDVLADMLSVSVKTFRAYKREGSELKENIQEQVLMLISLFHHGLEVFGDAVTFEKWLSAENFHFSMAQPLSYLNTILGIRFVDSRLVAIEYGDNV